MPQRHFARHALRKRYARASNSFVKPVTNSRRRWRNGPPNGNAAEPIWLKRRGSATRAVSVGMFPAGNSTGRRKPFASLNATEPNNRPGSSYSDELIQTTEPTFNKHSTVRRRKGRIWIL